MMARLPGRVASLGLVAAVAAYFAVGCTLSLEYLDEGQIVYPSWLVSLGAVPYKDFGHLYGPALFVLNGTLFRWFGPDLIVVRISLVLLKTVTVVLAYLIARQLASRAFALVACSVLVAVWGTPWWIFNTPYANHYSLTLTLGALLCFLSLPHRFRLGCVLAGLCFGFAATFKPTAGAFGLAGFALFLILARDALEASDLPAGPSLPAWGVRGARLAALAVLLSLFVAYLWHRNTIWNVVVLFTPAALTLGVAFVRELRGPVRRGMCVGLWGMVHAAVGAAVPILGIGIYYAAQGWLSNLLFNLISGLPQTVAATYYQPFSAPNARAALAVALVAASFAAVGLARSHLRLRAPRRAGAAAASLLLVSALLLFLARSSLPMAVIAYLRSRAWYGTILAVWYAVPLASLGLTGFLLLRSSPPAAAAAAGRGTAVLLVYCNAVAAWLLAYPVADLVHIMMGLPVVAPLWAFLLERFYRPVAHEAGSSAKVSRWVSGGLIGALAACMAAPSVDHLMLKFARSRADATALARATGIHGTQPKFGEVANLLAYLDAQVPADRELVFLSCEQLLYFLSGRRSALEQNEFDFYLLCSGQLSNDDARQLIDERLVIDKLSAAKPVIIDGGDRRTNGRLQGAFREMSRYIDAHYHVAARVGRYRILQWSGE